MGKMLGTAHCAIANKSPLATVVGTVNIVAVARLRKNSEADFS